uniref:C-type lectin domain-containing protein n=2 Tax=Graphocephala atropunctata TaxID=36148 RepID=A0A1B6L682_9HEMI
MGKLLLTVQFVVDMQVLLLTILAIVSLADLAKISMDYDNVKDSKYRRPLSSYLVKNHPTENTLHTKKVVKHRTWNGKGKAKKKQYYVHHHYKVNWDDAKKLCQKMHKKLVSIRNEEEWKGLKKAIIQQTGTGEFWTSGTDLVQEGKFVWASDWKPFTFTNWNSNPREPSNKSPWGSEDCVQINRDFTWNDRNCFHVRLHFICED